MFLDAKAAHVNDPDALLELEEQQLQDPAKYAVYPTPAIWGRPVELTQHIEVAMHIFFLGVCKSCNLLFMDWLSLRFRLSSFCQYAEDTLEMVKADQLSWCKALAFKKGTLGGCLSENYLAWT